MTFGALLVEPVLVASETVLPALLAKVGVGAPILRRQLRPSHAGLVPERPLLLVAAIAFLTLVAA